MENTTVAEIADSKLCCSCGGCAWICPVKAITFVETVGGYLLPSIDQDKCTNCSICRSICPGKGFAQEVIDRLPQDPFTGTCLEAHVGKATDPAFYGNSQSGGIVTALLANALQSGKIGAALIVVMEEGSPPRPHAWLARNRKELIKAQKSKYAPVPLLIALQELAGLKQSVAVVGVACQIHGLLNILACFPRLQEQILFKIGLVCDRVMTFGAIDFLTKKANLLHKEKLMFHFRDKSCRGYPGIVNIHTPDGASVLLPARARVQIKDYFTPARCRLCFDKMNVFADIVVCDPHGIDEVDRTGGESVAVIRTELGRQLFQTASDQGALAVREISYKDIIMGQGIQNKRIQWRGYTDAWRMFGYQSPNFVETVRLHASAKNKSNVYQKHLRHALALDKYSSRQELLDAAKKHFFYQQIRRYVFYPFRVVRKVLASQRFPDSPKTQQ